MTNHVHIIVDVGANQRNISELMKRLADRQTRYVNKLENRSGTLWESRFKASPIVTDSYLLQCCRNVELNPVKENMCSDASQHQWSSYRGKMGLPNQVWIDSNIVFDALG